MAGEKRTAFSQDGRFKQPLTLMEYFFFPFRFRFKMADKYSEWVFCWVYEGKVSRVTFDEAAATETLLGKHVWKCLKRIFLELKMSWLWTLFLLLGAMFLMFDLFDPKVLWWDYVLVFFVQRMTLILIHCTSYITNYQSNKDYISKQSDPILTTVLLRSVNLFLYLVDLRERLC